MYNVAHGVQPEHEVLQFPFRIPQKKGTIQVLKKKEKEQARMGEALTLDGVVNSIDAELIAKGHSAKGPNRGAIVRHGQYTLWAFEGPVANMTGVGRGLFINTVYYAAKQKDARVLEKKENSSRDGLFVYFTKKGLVRTMQQYLPKEAKGKSGRETYDWLMKNRAYLWNTGRPFEVDQLARSMSVANYKKEYLQRLIDRLREDPTDEKSHNALVRYTGINKNGGGAEQWQKWLNENRDYLYFSDTQGSVFQIDDIAKQKGVKTEQLRKWSSEDFDYRVDFDIVEQ